jgi:NAD(P)-dependent dehydrogenase (short-subunit alcohol dehydrogenase family)
MNRVWLITGASSGDLFELHLFGPTALTRAVLPHMRARRFGAIVQISSMGGQISFAGFSAYSATKFALEGMSEALADEVRPLGIKVLIVEPGAFRTGLFGNRTSHSPPDVASGVGGRPLLVVGGDQLRRELSEEGTEGLLVCLAE